MKEQPEQSALSALYKGSAISTISIAIGSLLLNPINSFIIIRYLGSAQFGEYCLLESIVISASTAISFGLKNIAIKFIPPFQSSLATGTSKRLIYFLLGAGLVLSFMISGVLLVGSDFLMRDIYNRDSISMLLKVFIVIIPITVFSDISLGIAYGLKSVKGGVIFTSVISPLFRLFLIILFLETNPTVSTLIYINISFQLLNCIGLVLILTNKFQLSKDITHTPLEISKEMKQFYFFISVEIIFLLLIEKVDINILAYLGASSNDIGIYATCLRLTVIMQLGAQATSNIFMPLTSELFSKQQSIELKETFQTANYWALWIALPVFITLVIFGSDVLLFFGKDFESGTIPLMILSCTALINIGLGLNGALQAMTGKIKINLINTVFISTFKIGLLFFFIPNFGLVGACISGLIASFLHYSFLTLQVLRHHHFIHHGSRVSKLLLIFMISFSLAYLLSMVFSSFPVHFKLFLLIIVFFVFVLFTLRFGLNEFEKHQLKKLLTRG